MLSLCLYVREKLPKSRHILPKALVFVMQSMLYLRFFGNLFTHLVKLSVTISIKNTNVLAKKGGFFSCFPDTFECD